MYVVITPPEDPAVSLDDMKDHLRVDHTDDDDRIGALVAAAQAGFEDPDIGWLRRPVALQEIEFSFDRFPLGWLVLPGPILVDDNHPVAVTYANVAGPNQTLAPAAYRLDRAATWQARLAPNLGYSWPHPVGTARVRCWAGFENDDPRIGNFQSAIKLHVEMNYDGVDDPDKYRSTIDALLSAYRFREF